MWARFTVLSEPPMAVAIAGCVIPLSRSNTIWMRWRCSAGIFHRNAVFSRRIWLLLHLTICSLESDAQQGITESLNPRHPATANRRFNQLWSRYQMIGMPFLFVPITTASYADLPPEK